MQNLIHVTFRLIYFRVGILSLSKGKDAVSPEIAGISTNSGITSVINENIQKILSIICEDKRYATQM